MRREGLKVFELKNGIQAVFEPEDHSEVVHAVLTIGAGTRDEYPEEQGMAHFIEHCLFKGTKKRNGIEVISQLDSVGGELNAYTTKEETCIYASFHKHFLERGLELIADIVFHSVFPPAEMRKEKTVIIDEIRSYLDSPSELIFDEFEEQVYKGHPLGHNILGTEKTLKRFDKAMVKAFMQRNYVPSRMTLSISGKLPEAKAKFLAEKYFGHARSSDGFNSRVLPVPAKPFKLKKNYSTFQDHVVWGGTAYRYEDKKRTAFVLLNNVLGGNAMNSRLNLVLREKHGFAYNVEASYVPYTDTGLFTIYFGTDKRNRAKCEELVLKELQNFRKKKFTSSQLEQAKIQLKGQLALSEENRLNRALGLGKSLLLYGKIQKMRDVYRRIEKVTAEEMQDVANELYNPDQLSRLVYTNK